MREKKDSGVDWIGHHPMTWEVTRIGSLYLPRNSKVSDTVYAPLSVTNKGIKLQLATVAKTDAHDARKMVRKGDFVINSRSDRRNACGVSSYEGSVSLINTVLIPQANMHPSYYDWLFRTSQFADEFYKWGHGIVDDLWTTGWQEMKKINIPYPPLVEQQAIANFLDTKCAEIDALMEDIRAEISTLEEYKKSVITEAVTKGLNPDAKMKDSGVAWVGECPEHWKILKIRDSISKIESGVSVNAASYPAGDNEIGVLKTSCVSKYIFDARENKAVNKNEESRVSCPVRKGCIIVSRMNTPDLVGACGYVAEEVNGIYLPDRLWQVHVKTTYSAQYVTYYLMSHIARSYYASIAVGTSSTMQNISQIEFGCMFFCVPEIEEQQAIADYLDAKCDEIAATIAEKQKQLTTLEEYKKSLIYEYVTGKKEVPTL